MRWEHRRPRKGCRLPLVQMQRVAFCVMAAPSSHTPHGGSLRRSRPGLSVTPQTSSGSSSVREASGESMEASAGWHPTDLDFSPPRVLADTRTAALCVQSLSHSSLPSHLLGAADLVLLRVGLAVVNALPLSAHSMLHVCRAQGTSRVKMCDKADWEANAPTMPAALQAALGMQQAWAPQSRQTYRPRPSAAPLSPAMAGHCWPGRHGLTLGAPGEVAHGAVDAAGLGLVRLGGEGCGAERRSRGVNVCRCTACCQ